MIPEKSKYCRYLKSAEDSLKKALLVDNYTNRSFTITTKISKSAKYPVRSPIKIINGANYESDASELNTVVSFCWRVAVSTSMAQNNLDMFFNVAEPSQRFIFIFFVNFSVVNYFQ